MSSVIQSRNVAYFLFASSFPNIKLVTRPAERKMIWTAIGILYPNAALFNKELRKKSETCITHRYNGIDRGLRRILKTLEGWWRRAESVSGAYTAGILPLES